MTNGNRNSTVPATIREVIHIGSSRKKRKYDAADRPCDRHRQPAPDADWQIKFRICRTEVWKIAAVYEDDLVRKFPHDRVPVLLELKYTGVTFAAAKVESGITVLPSPSKVVVIKERVGTQSVEPCIGRGVIRVHVAPEVQVQTDRHYLAFKPDFSYIGHVAEIMKQPVEVPLWEVGGAQSPHIVRMHPVQNGSVPYAAPHLKWRF